MARRYSLSSMLVLLCLVLCVSVSRAQWVKDGTAVCTEAYDQAGAKIVSNGANGAALVWVDYRNGLDFDIYGNAIDAKGYILGPSTGIAICTAPGNQYNCELIPDGTGGGIVVWLDERDPVRHVYAQRVDGFGNVHWTENGMGIGITEGYQEWARIISDGAGGAIIIWNDLRNGNYDIYAQRVDPDGTVLWDSTGTPVCTEVNGQYYPEMVEDGAGGALIAWQDTRNGNSDIYAQHIDGGGNVFWDADGVPVCTASGEQYNQRLIVAPSGGVYVVWTDSRDWYSDIYAQWIDQDGVAGWPQSDGIAVCPQPWSKYDLQLVSDGSGGLIVAWIDERSGIAAEAYAQRMDSGGNTMWSAYGIKAFPSLSYESGISMEADGNGGAILALDVYYDQESPNDIYAQRLDHDGNVLWGLKGAAVCVAQDYQYAPDLVPDGFGGAFVAWDDYRQPGNGDLYCQHISSSGLWGNPEPKIVSCLDVPADQGGWVRIRTRASSHDRAGELDSPIAGYNVWRMIGGGGGPLASSASPAMGNIAERSKLLALLSNPARAIGVRVGAAEAALLGLPEGDWESVGFWFATRDTLYNIAVPTKNDSTEAGIPLEIFIVTAHASIAGVFAVSEPDTGYSVDNLAPGMTPGFAGNETAEPPGLALSWAPNSAPDLWKYNVYRGDSALFVPDESSLLETTAGTTAFDPNWARPFRYYYKLIAIDRHGNPSPEVLLRPEDIKVGTLLKGFAASLSGSFVEISWTLSEAAGDVRFSVMRAEMPGGVFEEIAGSGIARNGLSFSLIDRSCEPGTTYRYRVEVRDEVGSRTLFETDEISTPAMPLTLHQNHPNPFNPSTVISYYVPNASVVTLDVYDSSGRLVSRLLDRVETPKGAHSVTWGGLDSNSRSVSSGVYFYRLTSGKETISKKMVLLR